MAQLEIYGQDHSPWVQAVLLGLHEKGIPYTLRTVPPRRLFLKSGILMPAARFDSENWQLDSDAILERVGFAAVSAEDKLALYSAWNGVAHRVDSGPRFWGAWSLVRDPNPSLLPRLGNHFLRTFAVLYFYLLISTMIRIGNRSDPENFTDQFLDWEERLEANAKTQSGPYLGGSQPGILDMMLFGIIQCHCSIRVPPVLALQEDLRLARLRSWIATMQERFADYEHLYSGVFFEPRSPAPAQSTALERASFWIGSAFMLLAFPISVPLIVFFARRIHAGD